MTTRYDPTQDLEQWMTIGTAECVDVTDNFATIEDAGPMTASQFQSMYDGGWTLLHPPVVSEDRVRHAMDHTYTFYKASVM